MKPDVLLSRLSRLQQTGRFPSTLALLSPSSDQFKTLCLDLAKLILCEQNGSSELFCNQCASCLKVKQQQHPDLRLLSTDKKQYVIEDIRGWMTWLNLAPYQSSQKVGLVWDAQKLSHHSANALLKTLEEPPAHAIIFLCCESRDQLLPTIASRTLNFRVSLPPENDLDEGDEMSWRDGLNKFLRCPEALTYQQLFDLSSVIAKDKPHLAHFFRVIHGFLNGQLTQPGFQSTGLERFCEIALEAERQTLIRYGNVNLWIDQVLLSWRQIAFEVERS